jgi:hypothetical protein
MSLRRSATTLRSESVIPTPEPPELFSLIIATIWSESNPISVLPLIKVFGLDPYTIKVNGEAPLGVLTPEPS